MKQKCQNNMAKFGSQKRLHFIPQGAASIVATPGLLDGAVGEASVAAGSDMDEELVRSSSTSPAFKQNTNAVCVKKCDFARKNCGDTIAMASRSLPLGGFQRKGVCVVHRSGSAQIHDDDDITPGTTWKAG
jgi:hypothetical protein